MTLILSGTNGVSDVDGTAATPAVRGSDTNTGIFFPAADTIAFAEGGAEVARFDASGNLGIGTSSPGTRLDVSGNLRFSAANPVIELNNGGAQVYSTVANTLQFASGGGIGTPTERARIDASGNLLVGNPSRASSERLSVWGTGANDVIFADTAGGTGYVYRTSTSSGLAAYFITSAGQAGLISCSGTTTSYNSGSDYRLKDNVRPLTGALETVAKLKPVAFEWKHDGSYGDSFLAHELQEVCPSAVTGEKDAVDDEGNPQYQGIDTSFLVATLTAAIQELKAIVDQQATEIANLKGQA